MHATDTQRRLLRVAGALLGAGFVLFALVTQLFHPHQHENNHPLIFSKYDHTDAWVIVHIGQFMAVLVALAGFVALHRVLELRDKDVLLTRLAFGATIATAAVWAVLQAVDGTALKETTEAWAHAKRHPVSSAAITVGGLAAAGVAFWAVGHFALVDKVTTALGL